MLSSTSYNPPSRQAKPSPDPLFRRGTMNSNESCPVTAGVRRMDSGGVKASLWMQLPTEKFMRRYGLFGDGFGESIEEAISDALCKCGEPGLIINSIHRRPPGIECFKCGERQSRRDYQEPLRYCQLKSCDEDVEQDYYVTLPQIYFISADLFISGAPIWDWAPISSDIILKWWFSNESISSFRHSESRSFVGRTLFDDDDHFGSLSVHQARNDANNAHVPMHELQLLARRGDYQPRQRGRRVDWQS